MKAIKLFMIAALLGICGSTFAQCAASAAKPEDKSTYFVQLPHTKEQCLTALVEIKDKGEKLLSELEYGCKSGDHTGYGFLKGTSEENVRSMIPASQQKTAKIEKVNKFTASEIETLHKDHMGH
jgi:hypothetical protein